MDAEGNEIGKIEGLNREARILWKIPNYFSLTQTANSFYDSPVFYFLGSSWSLRIYPNGTRGEKTVEFVGLYIRQHTTDKRHISFQIGIICGKDQIGKQNLNYFFNGQTGPIGWDKCIQRQYLFRNKHKIAPEGILTVKFVGNDAATQTRASNGVSGLVRDFQILLNTKQKSDVAIRVQNQVFRAHKTILGARSTVFAATFEHDMKQKKTGVVDIVDCDPSTFQHFLTFVYTGKVDKLSADNAFGLYSLANKYDVSDLKEICLDFKDFIKENLCLDMVCDVLAVAVKFNDEELINSAKKLLLENIKTVTSTKNWLRFTKKNPAMATEILVSAIPTDTGGSNSWRMRNPV